MRRGSARSRQVPRDLTSFFKAQIKDPGAVFHRRADAADLSSDAILIQGDRSRLSEYQSQPQRFSPHVAIDLILSSRESRRKN